MAKLTVCFVVMLLSQIAIADPKVTYVGLGRYTCSGSDRECEPVRRRNDELETQRQQTRELELQRREMEKQTQLMKSEQGRMKAERNRIY
jgi:hypothetical protein